MSKGDFLVLLLLLKDFLCSLSSFKWRKLRVKPYRRGLMSWLVSLTLISCCILLHCVCYYWNCYLCTSTLHFSLNGEFFFYWSNDVLWKWINQNCFHWIFCFNLSIWSIGGMTWEKYFDVYDWFMKLFCIDTLYNVVWEM